jgi:hypothetical protein
MEQILKLRRILLDRLSMFAMNWHTFESKGQAVIADRRFLLSSVLLGSLFLSLIASFFNPVLGRDAALYLDVAHLSQTQGFHAALERYSWPWFSVFVGILHRWSGIPLELVARLSCELLMAFTCLVSVDLVRKSRPDLAGWAALAVLAIPAFNIYRGDILREFGFWCFSMLALWNMSEWLRSRRGSVLLLSGLSILLATAFRSEAIYLVMLFAIALPLPRIQDGQQRGRMIALCLALLTLFVMTFFLALHYDLILTESVKKISVGRLLEDFSIFAQQTAQAMPFHYARDDVGLIIFLGLCGYVLVKILHTLGIFIIPWLIGWHQKTQKPLTSWLLLDITALGYAGILLIFVFGHLFLSRRYTTFLGFLLLPRIALGLSVIAQRWPRLKGWIVLVSILLAFAHVVSLSPQKTHLRDAGLWLGHHLPASSRVYMDEANRLVWYAGWHYDRNQPPDLEKALMRQGSEAYEYFALELKSPPVEPRIEELKNLGLSPIAEFRNRKGHAYVIFRRDKTR